MNDEDGSFDTSIVQVPEDVSAWSLVLQHKGVIAQLVERFMRSAAGRGEEIWGLKGNWKEAGKDTREGVDYAREE